MTSEQYPRTVAAHVRLLIAAQSGYVCSTCTCPAPGEAGREQLPPLEEFRMAGGVRFGEDGSE